MNKRQVRMQDGDGIRRTETILRWGRIITTPFAIVFLILPARQGEEFIAAFWLGVLAFNWMQPVRLRPPPDGKPPSVRVVIANAALAVFFLGYAIDPWVPVAGGRVWPLAYLLFAAAVYEAIRGWRRIRP